MAQQIPITFTEALNVSILKKIIINYIYAIKIFLLIIIN
jgi:hypothetical protein